MAEMGRPMSEEQARAYWDGRAERTREGAPAPELSSTVTDQVGAARLRDQLEMAHFSRIVTLRPWFRVLDLAGGAGRVALRVAPHVRHVTIMDLSEAQLSVARRAAEQQGIVNVSFVHGSLSGEVPYGGPYELVLLMGACLYLADDELAGVARRCREALVPGGQLVLKEPVSTTGEPIEQMLPGDGTPYQARFRPREQLVQVFGHELCGRYQSVTCAHPFPWFVGGTDGAVGASQSLLEHPALGSLRSFYVRLDPQLRRWEQRLRSWPLTRPLLAPTPVVQDFIVFAKPERAAVDLSIVVIAFNEERCLEGMIEELLEALRNAGFRYEIVVVDDGSRDRTPALIEQLTARHEVLRGVRLRPNRGIGGALRAGFDAAQGAYVTWLPADGQIPPQVVGELFALRARAPMLTTVYRTRADPFYRKLISQTLNTLIRVKTGQVAKSGGNYLFERRMWERFAPRSDDSMMLSTAFRANLRAAGETIEEVEIDCRARVAGHSKVLNPRAIWRTLSALLRMRHRS